MEPRYVIFDLDDTLVHSDAVREAFAVVADAHGIDHARLTRTLDALPGRPADAIFEHLGFAADLARVATERFFAVLDDLNATEPPVAYPDAGTTLRELADAGARLMLSTGSSPERARRVLAREGWHAFAVVLGSDERCHKGAGHYDRMAEEAAENPGTTWTTHAATIGDSPHDMRLGAEHGVPVRIGIARRADPQQLYDAGATHVVSALADVVPILTSQQIAA